MTLLSSTLNYEFISECLTSSESRSRKVLIGEWNIGDEKSKVFSHVPRHYGLALTTRVRTSFYDSVPCGVNCYTLPALTSMITVGSLTEGVRSFLEDFLTILLLLNPPRLLNSNSKLLRKLVFFFSFFDNWGIQLSGSFNSASLFFQLLSQFYRIIEKVMY